MAREYDYEVAKVGAAIMAHRIALGVSFGELVTAGGPGTDQTFRFVERADHPSILMIERHHAALMQAWPAATGGRRVQLPRREQWYATEEDMGLWHRAMATSATVGWWWAARNEQERRGVLCHLCSEIVHGYDVGRGVTAPVRKAVMAHRMIHITELRAALADAQKESTT